MLDRKADEVDVSINGRDFTIRQSPGILQSKREGGTTGAALWRACVWFAEWLGSEKNVLFEQGVLGADSMVMELGSGISGLVPLIMGRKVHRVVATDQKYALKLLQENITNNIHTGKANGSNRQVRKDRIDVLPLDWETSDVPSFLRQHGLQGGLDALFVCDCIFNYALIKPLVQTCLEVCKTRPTSATGRGGATEARPTLCVIAQQLRQPDVFEQWLKEFMTAFHVWRVPDEMLTEDLKEGQGFVIHVGVLRESA
jgi:hypothetical protein